MRESTTRGRQWAQLRVCASFAGVNCKGMWPSPSAAASSRLLSTEELARGKDASPSQNGTSETNDPQFPSNIWSSNALLNGLPAWNNRKGLDPWLQDAEMPHGASSTESRFVSPNDPPISEDALLKSMERLLNGEGEDSGVSASKRRGSDGKSSDLLANNEQLTTQAAVDLLTLKSAQEAAILQGQIDTLILMQRQQQQLLQQQQAILQGASQAAGSFALLNNPSAVHALSQLQAVAAAPPNPFAIDAQSWSGAHRVVAAPEEAADPVKLPAVDPAKPMTVTVDLGGGSNVALPSSGSRGLLSRYLASGPGLNQQQMAGASLDAMLQLPGNSISWNPMGPVATGVLLGGGGGGMGGPRPAMSMSSLEASLQQLQLQQQISQLQQQQQHQLSQQQQQVLFMVQPPLQLQQQQQFRHQGSFQGVVPMTAPVSNFSRGGGGGGRGEGGANLNRGGPQMMHHSQGGRNSNFGNNNNGNGNSNNNLARGGGPIRASPPVWASADWDPLKQAVRQKEQHKQHQQLRQQQQQQAQNSGTGVFLPNLAADSSPSTFAGTGVFLPSRQDDAPPPGTGRSNGGSKGSGDRH